jgi:plasmid stabilization system protein ParE
VKPYVVAPDAEADLKQIWRYLLGEAGLAVANQIQGELVDAFEILAEVPGKGHRRPDLTSRDVLFFGVYQYLIVYRRAAVVEIVAVLHGKRDVKRLLRFRLSR